MSGLSIKGLTAVLALLGVIVGGTWAVDARIEAKSEPALRVACYNSELLRRLIGNDMPALPDCRRIERRAGK